jgi:NAD(P)-dependent dehydrogenase (short-subunit alcohol dehydrogenase family)
VGRLDGKVAVVTGAAQGIGAEVLRRFREEGAQVAGADLSPGTYGDLSLQVDVADEAQVERLYSDVKAHFGRIDVLVNNAGINPPTDGSVLETPFDVWQQVLDVNLRSVFSCCKYGIPHLLENEGPNKGSVVNVASFVAIMGAATSQIAYTASKGGVLALSRELGVEFARQGVRVNALCPGPVDTPLLRELFAADPARAARRLVHVPMGRFAEPAEIANGALFLASDEASFVTASAFLVDGGLTGAYVTPE